MCTNIFLVINYINFKHIKKTLELEDETFFNNDWKLFKTIFIFITPHYHLLLVAANDPLGEHWSHRDLKCFPPPSVRQMMTPNFTFSLSPGTERRVLPILKVHLKVHLKFLPIICVLLTFSKVQTCALTRSCPGHTITKLQISKLLTKLIWKFLLYIAGF